MRKLLCRILGHKLTTVIEFRYRPRNKLYQFGGYYRCLRCGKKLSNWSQWWTSYNPSGWFTKEQVDEYLKSEV